MTDPTGNEAERSVGTDAAARCPRDGQTLEWHQHVGGSSFNDKPRSNGEFIGCNFGRPGGAA